MQEEAVRWTIKVSKDTDLTLRTFLGPQGTKGDRSKFIEEAVRRRVLQCTIQDIRTRNADADPDHIQRVVDEAVREVRNERRSRQTPKALMRVVLDTNVIVSALIAPFGNPAASTTHGCGRMSWNENFYY